MPDNPAASDPVAVRALLHAMAPACPRCGAYVGETMVFCGDRWREVWHCAGGKLGVGTTGWGKVTVQERGPSTSVIITVFNINHVY